VDVPESGKSVECIQHNKQEAWLQPGSNFLKKQPYLECCTICLTINVFPFGIYVSYIWVTTMHTDPLIKSTHILHLLGSVTLCSAVIHLLYKEGQ
jgi:hypothetical protein